MTHFTAQPEHGIAWVTGASSGIGRALAERLAGKGFTVAVTARDLDRLLALQAEVSAKGSAGRIIVLDGDVTDPRDMERVIAVLEYEHGRIALAVLNAGVYLPVDGASLHREDFEKTFAVNLHGVVNCLLPAIEHMKAGGQGQIAIVSSVTGYGGLPTGAAYGATKAALINLAESLKFDLDPLGIRIQVVNPGFVATPATAHNDFEMPALIAPEEAARRIEAGLASSRFEITFPRRFTYLLKLLRVMPYALYFAVVAYMTGWNRRPPKAAKPVSPSPEVAA
ncbi:SDR family NAD(P)-dependent oxidoreductase [Rhizobium sp. TRM95111]|uniref:SDR family NAD(P)-dependent oxidoreductase n=1 Tax=Rhizobium alarense TaxID=2846851 RepID=UPI001F1A5CA1|nr:SDR family NAD(P)-dependent oxidoreductase [Rhizobium alarense]MCF3640055.1 SDR family NAD(P)-dependent oxidoreductase [Rhizobium alarense]